jgi:hypothetical protein
LLLAARVLESLDITIEEVRVGVARIVGRGDEVRSGQIPFTPRAKRVLESALRQGLGLNECLMQDAAAGGWRRYSLRPKLFALINLRRRARLKLATSSASTVRESCWGSRKDKSAI